jgi:hypothetical protein
VNVRVPPTAGVSQRAVRQVTGLPEPSPAGDVHVPPTAGVSQRAVRQVTGLPEPSPAGEDPLVEDHLMMHIVGVVLAQQYSVNKGIAKRRSPC